MAITFIPYDGWTPGAGYYGEGWSTANNMIPAFASWRPWRKLNRLAGTSAFGPITGAHPHLWMSGAGSASYVPDAVTLFAGSKTRLFTVNPTTGAFADVSRAANYGGGATEPSGWRFASVGNDIYATNWTDPVQRRVNNAGLFTDGLTGAFLPQPRFLAVVREHLVGANLSNASRFQDETVWSDADNQIDFNPPTGTSTSIAGSKRLISIPGQITGLLGGQWGLAFKRGGVLVLEYTGTSQVFRPEVVSSHVGTAYPSSIINTRYGVFFLGPDGFYRMEGLGAPYKVSSPGIDQFLMDSAFSYYSGFTAVQEDSQMYGFHIAGMPLVGWVYRLSWGQSTNDRVLFHNPVSGAWSYGDIQVPADTSTKAVSVMLSRPYALTVQEALSGFTWDGTESRFAVYPSSGSAHAANIGLRFRPVNFENSEQRQTLLAGVLPVFSTLDPFGAPALTAEVTVEAVVDLFQTSITSETRAAATRDTVSGFYPFEIAGRAFRITVNCAAEDFQNFEGVYISTRELT